MSTRKKVANLWAPLLQSKGNSTTQPMSQKAVSDELSQLKSDLVAKSDVLSLEEIQNDIDLTGKVASAKALKDSSQYFFDGIDTNNTIFYTNYLTSNSNYTATEDCYVMGRCYPGQSNINLKFQILIDNIFTYMINSSLIGNSILAIPPIPLKIGQTINFESNGQEYTYIVFGVKR